MNLGQLMHDINRVQSLQMGYSTVTATLDETMLRMKALVKDLKIQSAQNKIHEHRQTR